MKKIILHGGGDDIKKIFNDLTWERIFNRNSVAYVVIAVEKSQNSFSKIKDDFPDKAAFLKKLCATDVALITLDNFDEMFKYDTLILSGGNTEYLIEVLITNKFKEKLLLSSVKNVVGISTGAIALSNQGIGSKHYVEFCYDGLGIINDKIIVHYRNNRSNIYKDFIKLMEYQYLTREPIHECTEVGLDFDNNRFGFGMSSEIEFDNETERRYKGRIKMAVKAHYIRIWILKYVLYIGTNEIEFKKKNRNNFKIVYGWGN